MKSRNQGFTLIELVVVIVILGILAAVAAPRFINVQSDARASAVRGVEASLRSAASLIYAKALIEGDEAAAAETVTIDAAGTVIATRFGYPDNASIVAATDIQVGSSGLAIEAGALGGAPTRIGFDVDGDGNVDLNCSVAYTETAGVGVVPNIGADVTNC